MSTKTLGTNATTTLSAIVYANDGAGLLPADIATISNSIKDDLTNKHPTWPGAFTRAGLLYIPNRGVLQVRPGDYVAVDATGWPILVSANAIASSSPATSWTHS
jgi:hypothetical protein